MPFVNEAISNENIKLFGLEETNLKYRISDGYGGWAVDKDRHVFVRKLPELGPPVGEYKTYEMGWGGRLFHVYVKFRADNIVEIDFHRVPSDLKLHRNEIIEDFKTGLSVYGSSGIYNYNPAPQYRFVF